MNIEAYLERINYRGTLTVTAETLRNLHIAHMLTVPFENLSIHLGEPIILEDAALFNKIVKRRRGGFCYELNGLFAYLLSSLGFQVTMLSARVIDAGGVIGPEFDHMALMIKLEERWLVDVGFGDSFCEPLLLDERHEQVQGDHCYRIDTDDTHLLLMQKESKNSQYSAQYRFTLQPYQYADYAEMCHYHQTSPESPFTQRRICSQATPTGRITLTSKRFIKTVNGERQERALTGEEEYLALLREHFGIDLTS
ncbi:MAG: arylamine N-acetyltransferase [Acidobacteriota bacterium]